MTSKGITPVVATTLLMVIAVAAVASASVFLEGTLEDFQDTAEEDLEREDLKDSSDIRMDYIYNDGGYMIVDLRNSGSQTIQLEDNDQKLFNMYIDNKPEGWEYVDASMGGDEKLDPNSVVSLNTTIGYPEEDKSKEISFKGPYETSDTDVCYSDGGTYCAG